MSFLRTALLLVSLLIASAVRGQAPPSALVFHFETAGPAGRGVLDLGRVAADHGRRAGGADTVIRKRIFLRLDGGPAAPVSARVWVSLPAAHPGVRVRVDGVELSAMPSLIDPVHRIGANVSHAIEVIVPREVEPGPFLDDLLWTAETD